MGDRIDLADVGEELIAQALAAACALYQAGDVHEVELGRRDLRRSRQRGDRREPVIRHRDPPEIGRDGGKGVIRRHRAARLGERVEQTRLADIGQADDAAAESHHAPGVGPGRADGFGGGHMRATRVMKPASSSWITIGNASQTTSTSLANSGRSAVGKSLST